MYASSVVRNTSPAGSDEDVERSPSSGAGTAPLASAPCRMALHARLVVVRARVAAVRALRRRSERQGDEIDLARRTDAPAVVAGSGGHLAPPVARGHAAGEVAGHVAHRVAGEGDDHEVRAREHRAARRRSPADRARGAPRGRRVASAGASSAAPAVQGGVGTGAERRLRRGIRASPSADKAGGAASHARGASGEGAADGPATTDRHGDADPQPPLRPTARYRGRPRRGTDASPTDGAADAAERGEKHDAPRRSRTSRTSPASNGTSAGERDELPGFDPEVEAEDGAREGRRRGGRACRRASGEGEAVDQTEGEGQRPRRNATRAGRPRAPRRERRPRAPPRRSTAPPAARSTTTAAARSPVAASAERRRVRDR